MTPESEAQELKEALEYVDDPERYAKPAWWADRRLDIIAAAYRAESKHSQGLRDENERLKGAIIGQDNSATVAELSTLEFTGFSRGRPTELDSERYRSPRKNDFCSSVKFRRVNC